jgi:hypothetical protein
VQAVNCLIDAILAANAGFLVSGAVYPAPAGFEPISAAKGVLGQASLAWLHNRLRWR